jgi:hypothetical protein
VFGTRRREAALAVQEAEGSARRSWSRSALGVATLIGAGRVGVGMVALAQPVTALKLSGVDTGTASRVAWVTRLFGAREVGLGAGTLAAIKAGEASGPRGRRMWLTIGALVDVTDALAFATALRDKRLGVVHGAGGVAIASTSAVACAAAALTSRH